MGGCPKGYSAAEAALYWAADHAPPGAAVEVSLTLGERLDIRMTAPHSQRTEKRFRVAVLHVNADDEGVSASPPADGHLLVRLRRTAFGVTDVAPLALTLPPEVAVIVIAAGGRLVHARPAPKELTVEVECPPLTPRTHPNPAQIQPAST